MKKVLIAAFALVSLTQAANAQKGSVLLYGNVGLGSDKAYGATTSGSSYNVTPGIGYQFNDNWTAGVNLNVEGSKDAASNKTSTIGVGPFIRYSKSLSNLFSIYTQLDLGYHGTKNTSASNVVTKTSGFDANIHPAIGVNISNGFALNVGFGNLGYTSDKIKGSSLSSKSSFGLTFGNGISLGVSKNFGGTKVATTTHHMRHRSN